MKTGAQGGSGGFPMQVGGKNDIDGFQTGRSQQLGVVRHHRRAELLGLRARIGRARADGR
jgi:hypothetical protein